MSSIEDLLEIVKTTDKAAYGQVIIDRKSWPILYHLSSSRENLLNWIPVDKKARVLEVGAECGALTGMFCRKAASVLAIDSSDENCQVNRIRHKDESNLEVVFGDYKTILDSRDEKYDLITLIGGEYDYSSVLPYFKNKLRGDGRIVIAVDNRLGLKYMAGCSSDGSYMVTKSMLESALKQSGFSDYEFYYPYPDYRLPSAVFSDDHLPSKGELLRSFRYSDKDKYSFFDESKVYDDILSEGSFPTFSNSFLVVIGKSGTEKVVFSKSADNRDYQYQIHTDIVKTDYGIVVQKTNLLPEGMDHLRAIHDNEAKLRSVFGDKVDVCKSDLFDDHIEFVFIEGDSLDDELIRACASKSVDEICSVLDKTYDIIRCMKTGDSFIPTEEFVKVFGASELPNDIETGNVVNVDLIPANLINRNGKYTIIDYEWVFDFSIPLEYVFWRVLFSSMAFSRLDDGIKDEVCSRYGLTDERRAVYLAMEKSFQNYVQGDAVTLHRYELELPFEPQSVAELESEKQGFEQAYKALDNELNIIKNSKSWKILKFFKIVKG